jgi:eukaryotic-like serine/threonine-protein kinase
MPLSEGARLGPYVVTTPLGAGGMGEVYRAHDTRLGRDVALKILPPSVARDPDRLGRFEREARAIAALSHPNIVAVFDTGTAEVTSPDEAAGTSHAVTYVVMELLTGETLAARLSHGPIPARKAAEIARLIARGLAAAHDKGIVHRDLKPDNVFLTVDGQVKLLDFGLARHTTSPATTATTVITHAGTVLGTVSYMSPEQVRGEPVDARADLFALGAVLYEMVSGHRPFDAATAAETMTAILRTEPPDFPHVPAVPPALQRIILHCLEKRPEERFQNASDVAFALDALSGSVPATADRAAAVPPARPVLERLAWMAAVLLLTVLAAWLAATRPLTGDAPGPILRATLPLPAGIALPSDGPHSWRLALSPDGTRVAFVGQTSAGERSLWVRALDSESATVITGTRNPSRPFWSPDSRELAFSDDGRLLRVTPGTGRPLPLGTSEGRGTWGAGDRLLISFGFGAGHRLLSPGGGASREVLTPTPEPGQVALYPSFLPDGQRVVFALYDARNPQSGGFYTADIDGGTMREVLPANFDTDSSNVVVTNGHLLSVRGGTLLARSFDVDGLTVRGEPFAVGGPVDAAIGIGSAAYAVADHVVVYQPAPTVTGSTLVWLDRTGAVLEEVGSTGDYGQLDLSPDGARLIYSLTDQSARTRDIWVLDVRRGVPSRVTFDPADERGAVWAPDGQRFVYRKGMDLHIRNLTDGQDTPLVVDDRSKDPQDWSPVEDTVLYRVSTSGRGGGSDLWIARDGEEPRPFLDSPFNEGNGQFSPDGQWVAYTSNESGETDVYVTAYPSAQGKWRISSSGGSQPRWRADGRELYYLSPANQLMSVEVRTTETGLDVGPPSLLFPISIVRAQGAQYVVSGNGTRFLVNTPVPADTTPALHVVFNWTALAPRD